MRLNYAVRQIGDITVFDLSGRIGPDETIGDRFVLQDLSREQVNTGHHKILLNLREVTYINSSGIAGLLASLNAVRQQGGELRICDISKRVGDVLRRTRIELVLNIDMNESTALQAFSGEAHKKSPPKTAASAGRRTKYLGIAKHLAPTPTWTCPHCQHVHTPATLLRLDCGTLQCELLPLLRQFVDASHVAPMLLRLLGIRAWPARDGVSYE